MWTGEWDDARGALRGARSGLAALACLLPALHEGDAISNKRQQVRAVEPSPAGLRHVEELVGHQQALRPRARALRHALAEPHRRERRLDHVGRAQMLPVVGSNGTTIASSPLWSCQSRPSRDRSWPRAGRPPCRGPRDSGRTCLRSRGTGRCRPRGAAWRVPRRICVAGIPCRAWPGHPPRWRCGQGSGIASTWVDPAHWYYTWGDGLLI